MVAAQEVPDGTVLVYRYRLLGDLPEPVKAELRLRHDLANRLVKAWKDYRSAVAAAWEEDPEVGPVLAAQRKAQEKADEARAAAAKAAQKLGYAKQRGIPSRVTAAKAAAGTAREAKREAIAELKTAKEKAREIKGLRLNAAERLMNAAKNAYDEEIKGTYAWYREQGGYWANWADTTRYHRAAEERVKAARAQNQPADLQFRRWDGTGTVTVQLQRQTGVTAELRAEVASRKAAGESPKTIGAGLGMSAMTVARMKPDGPVTAGDPPRSPAMLASPESKWRNVLSVSALPGDFTQLPRGERRAAARTGMVCFRTGSEENRAVSQMRAVIHRPMRPDADITYARITVSRRGPDLEAHLTLTARVPAPARQHGRLAAVHAGWRVLEDGSLRVAVISGAGPLPRSLAEPAGPGGKASALDGCVRLRDGIAEVILPKAWRDEQDHAEALRSARDKQRDAAIAAAAGWLETHPQPEPDPGRTPRLFASGPAGPEPLPAPHAVRRWRSAGRLGALGRRCRDGLHGEAAKELGDLIGEWSGPDQDAWRAEAKARANLIARRDDLYGRIAAWLADGAGEIRVDEWSMRDVARKPKEDDDPQAKAARANRFLAAPGELRSRVRFTAALAGVTVTDWEPDGAGKTHHGCGGILDPDERRRAVTVRCGSCAALVDQDLNMLAAMTGVRA